MNCLLSQESCDFDARQSASPLNLADFGGIIGWAFFDGERGAIGALIARM